MNDLYQQLKVEVSKYQDALAILGCAQTKNYFTSLEMVLTGVLEQESKSAAQQVQQQIESMRKTGNTLEFWPHFFNNMQIFKANFYLLLQATFDKIWENIMTSYESEFNFNSQPLSYRDKVDNSVSQSGFQTYQIKSVDSQSTQSLKVIKSQPDLNSQRKSLNDSATFRKEGDKKETPRKLQAINEVGSVKNPVRLNKRSSTQNQTPNKNDEKRKLTSKQSYDLDTGIK